MMRSVESASSVFYHSQEEDLVRTGVDPLSGPLYDSYQDSTTDSSPATTEQDAMGTKLCACTFVCSDKINLDSRWTTDGILMKLPVKLLMYVIAVDVDINARSEKWKKKKKSSVNLKICKSTARQVNVLN